MTPFQKIPEACKTTGLSQYYLRKGCKDGSIPHVRSGQTYYINVPELLEKLKAGGTSA
ncbi:MAG: helix-turn-helix domain-containing protein [Dysosmobacter sp.]|nr:helix-turn-helix domain-containing protein [Dysosmobacter sp.]